LTILNVGFGLDVSKDLSMAQGLPVLKKTFWDAIETGCYWGGGVLFTVGIFFMFMRHSKVKEIKKETTFQG
jgi:hypothetical protein